MWKVGDRVGVSREALEQLSFVGHRRPLIDDCARVARIFTRGRRIFSIEVEFEYLPGIYFNVLSRNIFRITRT